MKKEIYKSIKKEVCNDFSCRDCEGDREFNEAISEIKQILKEELK